MTRDMVQRFLLKSPRRLTISPTVLMTDPAVPYLPNSGYPPYDRGHELGVFLKMANGSESLSVVWPGKSPLLHTKGWKD